MEPGHRHLAPRRRALALALALGGLIAAAACSRRGSPSPPPPAPSRVIHLADGLAPASLAIPDEPIDEAFLLEFDRPQDVARVAGTHGIEGLGLGPDGLRFRTTAHRSWIDIRLDVEAARSTILLLRIRRSAGHIRPRVGWTIAAPGGSSTPGRRNVKARILRGEDPYLVCWIPVEDDPQWRGRIARLRVYPTNQPGCEVEIDRIRLVRASVQARWKRFEGQTLSRGKVAAGGETREALLAPPPRRYERELVLPARARLDVGYAILERGWRPGAPGAEFRVLVRRGSAPPRCVLEERLDPADNPADRAWRDRTVDLSSLGGRRVTVILETRPGSAEQARYVPAVWSDPVLYRPGLEPAEPNLLLVSLDTTRADRLGTYGEPLPTSPYLDRLARRNLVFETLVSQAASTGPSHMSLFLSRYPTAHGILNHDARLPDEALTLAEILRDAGFATGAFTEGGYISASLGFDQGFASYGESAGQKEDTGGFVEETFGKGVAWLRRHRDRRFFLFLHTYEDHVPYCPGPPYDSLFDPKYEGPLDRCLSYEETKEINYGCIGSDPDDPKLIGTRPASGADLAHVEALYHGEIRKTDAALGKLLASLARLGLARNTVVLVLSDHGEDFLDHLATARHGRSLYREMLHVPAVLRIPGLEGSPRRIARPVSMVDLLPTLLGVLGVPPPRGATFAGEDLLPLLRGAGEEGRRTARASSPLFAENYSMANRAMIRRGRYKLIATREFSRPDVDLLDPTTLRIRGLRLGLELYDIAEDPGERHDLAAALPERTRRLEERLDAFLEGQERIRLRRIHGEMDEAERERLRQLGYLDDGPGGKGPGGGRQ